MSAYTAHDIRELEDAEERLIDSLVQTMLDRVGAVCAPGVAETWGHVDHESWVSQRYARQRVGRWLRAAVERGELVRAERTRSERSGFPRQWFRRPEGEE